MVEPFLTLGGEERFTLSMLKNLDRKLIDIELICNPAPPLLYELTALRIPIHYVRLSNKKDISSIPKIANIIRRGNFDLIHGHSSFAGLHTRIANLLAGKIPLIWTEHLLPHQHHRATLENKFLGSLYTIPFYILDNFTDALVYVSQSSYNTRLRYHPCRKKIMRVIANGSDFNIENAASKRNKFRCELNLTPSDILIGLITILKYQKGVDIFLRAFADASAVNPHISALIAGTGPDELQLKNLADNLNIAGKVRFLGPVRDVSSVLPAFDIAVLPSRFEGMPLTLLEYMSSGKPIIASDIPSSREILDNGSCGTLFTSENIGSLRDALLELAQNRSLAESLSQKAREHFNAHYTIGTMIDKYQQLYMEITKSR